MNKGKNDNIETSGKDSTRTWLALGLPFLSIVLLIIISSIYLVQSSDKAAAAKSVFNTTLPLIGTWVGTVLAFYFTSHNFDAAAKHARAMVNQLTSKEKLQLIIVQDVMIPIKKATTLTLNKKESDIKLKADMIDMLGKDHKERLPILDMDGRVRYIAHRSMIERFIMHKIIQERKPAEDISLLSLQDMLDNDWYREVLTSGFKTLHATSNLAEAKDLIDKVKFCSDVFVTEDGTPGTKALGWVTNVIVREQATV